MGANKVGKRYRGKGAEQYEAKRAGKSKWILEDKGVTELLPYNIDSVLDAPIGTGRFYHLYFERGFAVAGIDTSPDMLKEAQKKGFTDLQLGDIRKMSFKNKQFDVSVCIRLFAWFDPDEVLQALKELSRVSKILIVNIRTNEEQSFCKSNSLWNHYRPDFMNWVDQIGYKVDVVFHIGNKGNDIYRLVEK